MAHSLIDTHCHLDIIQEQGLAIGEAVSLAKDAGLRKIVQIGIDLPSSEKAVQIADSYSSDSLEIVYTIGCHPTETHEFPKADEILQLAKTRLSDPRFVGIGEIGMDLYHNADQKQAQRDVLSKFLDFSSECKLPVVIHSRDAFQDTWEGLQEYKGKAFGVIHCFTYDYEAAKRFIDLGYYISFSGILAFKNAIEIQEAAKQIPLECILIETDAPFLAPPPFRGKRNDSSKLPHILEKMFSLRSESNEVIESKLLQNSEKFIARKAYYA